MWREILKKELNGEIYTEEHKERNTLRDIYEKIHGKKLLKKHIERNIKIIL